MSTITPIPLRPCPFCGNPPIVRRTMQEYAADAEHPAGEYEEWVDICCDECGLKIGDEYRSEAAGLWNRRAATDDMLRELGHLSRLLEHALATPGYGHDANSREEVEAHLSDARAAIAKAEGR